MAEMEENATTSNPTILDLFTASPQETAAWIFGGLVLVFLMLAYLRPGVIDESRMQLLRYFAAVSAGLFGVFITGEALLSASHEISKGSSLTFQAVAGAALFGLVLFTWRFSPGPKGLTEVSISIPAGWTFEQAIQVISQKDDSTARFDGFTPDQLKIPLPALKLRASSWEEIMRGVGEAARRAGVPEFTVRLDRPVYKFVVRSE